MVISMDRYLGKRLDGRYEIQEIIGVGGMAVVYKAYDNLENRTVAVKILKEEFTSNDEFLRRFKNESKAIAMLSHQNIVKVHDVSFGDLIQYIVMEYIEGITLKEFIEHEGSLRWKDAVHFTLQILKGLQHAHDKGIVHRDVKPQNIMVLADGTIKVTDFGIARFARSDQRTITDKAIGSVHYISPEQARGEKTDEKADIYSVGVMLYEMITGKLPFQAESAVSVAIMQLQREPQLPTEINGSIPQGLEQITMHAMQKTPEKRYQSASEMLCDLSLFRKDPSLTFDYSYFVDNSPTKFVGGMNQIDLSDTNDSDDNEEETKEKNNIIPILAGIAVTLVVALVALAIIFIPKFLKGTGEEIECPNFVGQKIDEINSNEEYNENFEFELKWDHNEEYDYGVVYQQSETEGEKLKKDAEIILYISMGQTTKKVPDVYGKLESAAISELQSNGFTTVVSTMPSEETEEGCVIKTEPQRTEVVAEGAKITVYVSSGAPTKNVSVPDVVGLKKENAQKQLEKDGFVVEVKEVELTGSEKFYPVGIVTKQDPENSSEEVPEGTTVKIFVCSGYKYEVEVELPKDFVTETYYITLWADGTMINKGAKVNSADRSTYTFKNLTTTEEELDLTVKISKDGKNEQSLYDLKVDNQDGRVRVINEYDDYEKKVESTPEDTQGNQNNGSTDTGINNGDVSTNTPPDNQNGNNDYSDNGNGGSTEQDENNDFATDNQDVVIEE